MAKDIPGWILLILLFVYMMLVEVDKVTKEKVWKVHNDLPTCQRCHNDTTN
jgi:hypothetical protein